MLYIVHVWEVMCKTTLTKKNKKKTCSCSWHILHVQYMIQQRRTVQRLRWPPAPASLSTPGCSALSPLIPPRLTFFCRLLLISWIENVESLQCALQKVVAISGKIIRVNPCVCCARPVSLLNSAPTGGGRRRRNESDHYRLLGSRVTHRLWVIRSCKRVWPTKATDFCK